jgi:hypothetical protein
VLRGRRRELFEAACRLDLEGSWAKRKIDLGRAGKGCGAALAEMKNLNYDQLLRLVEKWAPEAESEEQRRTLRVVCVNEA